LHCNCNSTALQHIKNWPHATITIQNQFHYTMQKHINYPMPCQQLTLPNIFFQILRNV
jgi:hypothetical protein